MPRWEERRMPSSVHAGFRLLLHDLSQDPSLVSPSVKCSVVALSHSFHFFFSFFPTPPLSAGIEPRDHPPPLGPHACEASIYHCVLPLGLVLLRTVQASKVLPHTLPHLFLHLSSPGTTGLAHHDTWFYMMLEMESKDLCMPDKHFIRATLHLQPVDSLS